MNRIKRFAKSFGLGRLVCLILLGALVALRIANPAPLESMRVRTFDFYQVMKPRQATVQPAVIVDIDEASLKAYVSHPGS